MLQKVEGIVIRTQDYGETNKIVTLITRENGKVAMMAQGAKRPKSRFASASQLFVYGQFVYRPSSGLGTLNQGDVIDLFRDIKNDLMLTSYAAYVVEMLDRLTDERVRNPYLFELVYQMLQRLNEGVDPEVLLRIYETKMLTQAGVAPRLNGCVGCGETTSQFSFSLQQGGVLCEVCKTSDPYRYDVDQAVIKLLRGFLHLDLQRIGEVSLKERTKKQLRHVLNDYYDAYVGLNLKSKRFLEQMERMDFDGT
ncbi:DNA repair protein RecO [Texcoconibacillus texcoconensis]|uniref:DNA repair protein RecO n=1 Tax=Texcoconibacillus texcoconensis TaxID=1095777 RepID=A0A840QRI6_9BACI|nr:DNA repair protein RecO [Texcoconibacillus texcoconensis]MBB5173931.1 DNA repair protein RecO (recombination protein O) [Texcoconibacillus texcoconensis]